MWKRPRVGKIYWDVFLSLSLMYSHTGPVGEREFTEGNDSEQSDETGGRTSGVSRLRVLIG